VYWCGSCETALAEAEVEYGDHESPSVFVRSSCLTRRRRSRRSKEKASIVIWTRRPGRLLQTLPWPFILSSITLSLRRADKRSFWPRTFKAITREVRHHGLHVIEKFKGKKLEGLKARHPFLDRDSLVVLESTSRSMRDRHCAYCAGHGQEDYEVGLKYV